MRKLHGQLGQPLPLILEELTRLSGQEQTIVLKAQHHLVHQTAGLAIQLRHSFAVLGDALGGSKEVFPCALINDVLVDQPGGLYGGVTHGLICGDVLEEGGRGQVRVHLGLQLCQRPDRAVEGALGGGLGAHAVQLLYAKL